MRQIRFALFAGTGVLALCAIAVAWSIGTYVSPHAEVANAHVGPVVAPGNGSADQGQAPAPVPTAAVTQVPVQPQSTPFPGVPNTNPNASATQPMGGTADPTQQQRALDRFFQELQQLQQRRGRHG